jgi:predicted DNA-binding transcriptional regulator AlpA
VDEVRDRFLRLKDLADMFKVDVRTLWNWANTRGLPVVALTSRTKGAWESEVVEWAKTHGRGHGKHRR